MPRVRSLHEPLCYLIGLMSLFSVCAHAETFRMEARGDDPDGPVLFVVDEVVAAGPDQSVVIESSYHLLDGTLLQRETARFEESTGRVASFRLEAMTSGRVTEMKAEGTASLAIHHKDSRTSRPVTSQVAWSPSTVIGKTLVVRIIKEWQTVTSGKEFIVDLVVPEMGRAFSFRVQQAARKRVGTSLVTVKVQPDSWLLRPFAPSLEFDFETRHETVKMVTYRGPSPIVDGPFASKTVELRAAAL